MRSPKLACRMNTTRRSGKCDAFVSVFRTKVGKFTEEEFDVAHDQLKSSGAPHIYTFFEKAQVDIDELPPQDFAFFGRHLRPS